MKQVGAFPDGNFDDGQENWKIQIWLICLERHDRKHVY